MSKKIIVTILILLVFLIMVSDFRINSYRVFESFFRQMETESMRNMYNGVPRFVGETAEKEVGPFLLELNKDIEELIMDNPMGSINIYGEKRDDILLSYKITVYASTERAANEFIERLEVLAEESRNRLVIELAGFENSNDVNGWQVAYTLYVPEDLNLNLTNRYGVLCVSDIISDINLRNSYGSFEVDNIRGNSRLNASYGNLNAINISGDTEINSSYNNTEIRNIDGNLDLRSRYSRVTVDEVMGRIEANLSYGSFDLNDHIEELEIRARYTPINVQLDRRLTDYQLDISTRYGGINTNLDFAVEEDGQRQSLAAVAGNGNTRIDINGNYSNIKIEQYIVKNIKFE
ncbi:DUF4097 family beta strand repeat-containing protein [Natronospora cellulosivora (SeqCode)]